MSMEDAIKAQYLHAVTGHYGPKDLVHVSLVRAIANAAYTMGASRGAHVAKEDAVAAVSTMYHEATNAGRWLLAKVLEELQK